VVPNARFFVDDPDTIVRINKWRSGLRYCLNLGWSIWYAYNQLHVGQRISSGINDLDRSDKPTNSSGGGLHHNAKFDWCGLGDSGKRLQPKCCTQRRAGDH
jgi:hypothetical protein